MDDPPAPPSYWGAPICGHDCPSCAAETRSACDGDGQLESFCRRCGGTGYRDAGRCTSCGNDGRFFDGLVVTVTDMDWHVRHINLTVDPVAAVARAGDQPRDPHRAIVQLPPAYRLAGYLHHDGIDLADVTDRPHILADYRLLDGVVHTNADASAARSPRPGAGRRPGCSPRRGASSSRHCRRGDRCRI